MPAYRRLALPFVTILLALSLSLSTQAEVKLELKTPKTEAEKRIFNELKRSGTAVTIVRFFNDTFTTRKNITLSFGRYEKVWYENNRILIPYGFIDGIKKRYIDTYFPQKSTNVSEFMNNVLFHMVFHEFAHAIIEQYDIPVLGKEEDAADGLADVLLIHLFDNGGGIVTSAAELFFINSIYHGRYRKEDFWSEHSLDKQRYFQRLCHVYGSNPSRYSHIKERAQFDTNRGKRCFIQYRELERSWLSVLDPVFK